MAASVLQSRLEIAEHRGLVACMHDVLPRLRGADHALGAEPHAADNGTDRIGDSCVVGYARLGTQQGGDHRVVRRR